MKTTIVSNLNNDKINICNEYNMNIKYRQKC